MPSAGTPYSAHTQAARTIGAQSIGWRSSPCQALNWVLSRYGLQRAEPGQDPDQLEQQRDHQRAHDRGGAVARDRREQQPDADDRGDRDQVDEQAG